MIAYDPAEWRDLASLTGVIRGRLPMRNWRSTAPTVDELVVGIAGSIHNAWVLLIEILR